jgi:hypothetical protein
MSVYADGHEAVNQMIHTCRTRRQQHITDGGTEDAFISVLIEEFTEEAKRQPHGAGAANQALTIYWLGRLTDKVIELGDAVSMRNDALKLAWAKIDADEKLRDA